MHSSVSARPATHALPLALIVLALGILTVMPQWQRLTSVPVAFAPSYDRMAVDHAVTPVAGTMLPYGVYPGQAVTSSQHVLPYGTP